MKTRIGICLLLLLGALGLAQGPTLSAQEVSALTARNLRDACESLVLAVRGVTPISQEDPGAMLCLGFLSGWYQAMETVPERPFCVPENLTPQPGDVADLFVSWVDEHPDRASASAHEALLETFATAFPCSEAGTDAEEPAPQP